MAKNNNSNKRKGSGRSGAPKSKSNGSNNNNARRGRQDAYRNGKSYANDRDYGNSDKMSSENDISWYSRNPNLLLAAGSFPYPYRPGMDLNTEIQSAKGTTVSQLPAPMAIPGILEIMWTPTVGAAAGPTDPINVTAKQVYAKVRAAYSGSLEVDAPDFMVYLMALDSIFSYIASLKRLYRALNYYDQDNRLLPDGLLYSMGITGNALTNLRSQATLLWQNINTLVLQSRKFTCPALMDVFNRHYWMNDHVYTDSPTMNSQMYMFVQRYYYKFAEQNVVGSTTAKASGLEYIKTPFGSNATPASLLQFGTELIDALVAWDDAYTINGYLQRAYQDQPSFIVEEIEQGVKQEFTYSEEVLSQIQNTRIAKNFYSWLQGTGVLDTYVVNQDVATNSLINSMTFTSGANTILLTPTISVRSNNPTVTSASVTTRYMKGCQSNASSLRSDTSTLALPESVVTDTCSNIR